MLRLSVIVPFYNVELYIEDCICSLYNQYIPWEEYEVICVDDCSWDNSRKKVEELQNKYPTLKLISHEKNKRQGGARNTGLKEAKVQYIWYVDSDDYIYPNIFRKLLEVAELSMVDILQFAHTRGENTKNKELNLSQIITGENYLFSNVTNDWFDKISGPWKQIFNRDFLLNSGLKFIEGAMYEDTDYLLQAFLAAKKVQHISLVAYHYRINADSITITPVTPVKLAWHVNLIARCGKLINKTTTSIARETIATMVSHTLSQLRGDVAKFSIKEKLVYLKFLNDIGVCKKFISWRTWLSIRYGLTWFI